MFWRGRGDDWVTDDVGGKWYDGTRVELGGTWDERRCVGETGLVDCGMMMVGAWDVGFCGELEGFVS